MQGCLFVAVAIIGAVGFIHSLRWAQHKTDNIYAVAPVNYALAAGVFAVWTYFSGAAIHSEVVVVGALCGAIYGIAFFLVVYGMSEVGVGKTAVVMNLAQSMPIAASIIIWKEIPGTWTFLGMALAAIAIPMVLLPKMKNQLQLSVQGIVALGSLFVCQGVVYTAFKWFERLGRPDERSVLLMGLFVTTMVITIIVAIAKKAKPRKKEFLHGGLVGLFNVIANVGLVASLAVAAAGVVLPTITVMVVILSTVMSMWLWSERYAVRTYIGLAIAIAAVILVNL